MAEKETKKKKPEESSAPEVKEEEKESKAQSPEAEEPAEEKQEERRDERAGIVYIFTSQNNTMIHITDLAGNTISRVSGGMVTKHSRLKADPTIAMFVAKKAAERAKDLGITSLYVRMRGSTKGLRPGVGPGAHAAVKSLDKEGFKIISIVDTTRVPRGGPKKKGGKRGRRV